MGHLIPAGTGFQAHKAIRLVSHGEPLPEPLVMAETEEQPLA